MFVAHWATLFFFLFLQQCYSFMNDVDFNDEYLSANYSSRIFELYSDSIHHIQLFEDVAKSFATYGDDVYDVRFTRYSRFTSVTRISSICPSSRQSCLLHYPPVQPDRSCLVRPPLSLQRECQLFYGNYDSIVDIRAYVSSNVGISLRQLPQFSDGLMQYQVAPDSTCDNIEYANFDTKTFFSQYWLRQRPVVLKNFFHPARRSALNVELSIHASDRVGAKLSPTTDFEGIDDLINWEMAKSQHVPMAVLNQMESPHMVVVRAAHEEMSLGDVLDIIQWQHGRNKGSHSKVNENNGMAVHPHPGDFEAEPTHNRTSALQAQATANAYVEYMPLKDESLLRLFTHITNLGAEQRHQQQSVDQADYDTQRVVGDLLTEDVARKSRNNQVDRTADSNGERNYLNVALRNSMEDTSMHVLARHANWMKYLIEGKGHMWIGDGYTVGKLHFDPYDNILLQVEGAKRFRLVDPSDNTRMYEGHMREAELEAVRLQAQKQSEGSGECNKSVSTHDNSMIHNTTRKVCRNHGRSPWEYRFRKRKLSESTSMVHSPVDVNELYDAQHTHKSSADNDNTKRRRHNSKYPKASGVNTIDCVVEKGDALWVPSFWWHEVKSYPGDTNAYRTDPLSPEADAADKDDLSRNVITSGSLYPLNIAVNFWFAPLYDKEFPCASCKKSKLNQKYADVLRDLTASNLLE